MLLEGALPATGPWTGGSALRTGAATTQPPTLGGWCGELLLWSSATSPLLLSYNKVSCQDATNRTWARPAGLASRNRHL